MTLTYKNNLLIRGGGGFKKNRLIYIYIYGGGFYSGGYTRVFVSCVSC